MSSDNGETIATIAFDNMGIKKLMLSRAGLELVIRYGKKIQI